MSVQKCQESESPSVDFSICEENEVVSIIALLSTRDSNSSTMERNASSKRIAFIELSKNKGIDDWMLMDMAVDYSSIQFHSLASSEKAIACRYLCTSIDLLQIGTETNEFFSIEIVMTIKAPNMLDFVEIFCNEKYIVTWGLDGLISIWTKEELTLIKSYDAHSKYTHGVNKAICDAYLQ